YHRSISSPENMIRAETVEQVTQELGIPGPIGQKYRHQRAQLGIDVLDLGLLGELSKVGVIRMCAVERNEIQVREISRCPDHVIGVTVFFKEVSWKSLMDADVLDAMFSQHFIHRVGLLLVIHAPAASVCSRGIKFKAVDLQGLALKSQRFYGRMSV